MITHKNYLVQSIILAHSYTFRFRLLSCMPKLNPVQCHMTLLPPTHLGKVTTIPYLVTHQSSDLHIDWWCFMKTFNVCDNYKTGWWRGVRGRPHVKQLISHRKWLVLHNKHIKYNIDDNNDNHKDNNNSDNNSNNNN